MSCITNKIGYATEELAEMALLQAMAYSLGDRNPPIRTYKCEECGRYHMTSKENRYENVNNSHTNSTE